MSLLLFLLLIHFFTNSITDAATGQQCDNGWKSYGLDLCVQVLPIVNVNQSKAKQECAKVNGHLIAVKDKVHLAQLSTLIPTTVRKFWLGLEGHNVNSSTQYSWIDDNTKIDNYNHWNPLADKLELCVLDEHDNQDFWSDSPCDRIAGITVVCQKPAAKQPESDLEKLKALIDSAVKGLTNEIDKVKALVESEIKELTNQLVQLKDQLNRIVPIGFVYTQLPNQQAPTVLWPSYKWSDVSKEYASQFFRVEGPSSEPFGKVQQGQAPHLLGFNAKCANTTSSIGSQIHYVDIKYMTSIYDKPNYNCPTNHTIQDFSPYVNNYDVRPLNTAVRVFIRIG